jgi:hypothetical protein
MSGASHTKHVSDPEDNHERETDKKPLMNRMCTLAKRIPFSMNINAGIDQGYQQDGIVISQWHRHLDYRQKVGADE